MFPELQAFAERDAGFKQFYDRYEIVSANPEARKEYVMWFDEALRIEGMLEFARQTGRQEGRQEGLLAGEKKGLLAGRQEYEPKLAKAEKQLFDSARNMKNQGIPIETIAKAFSLSVSKIESL